MNILDRYLHYYQRFHGHSSALQYAIKQVAIIDKKLNLQADSKGLSYVDNGNPLFFAMRVEEVLCNSAYLCVEFLVRAAEQVAVCRRVLMYTYVLGYFLKDQTAEKRLFEHQQEMLEKHTEHLQEYTEKPLDTLDSSNVNNLTRITGNFMSSVLSTMTGGVVRIEEMQATPDKVKA